MMGLQCSKLSAALKFNAKFNQNPSVHTHTQHSQDNSCFNFITNCTNCAVLAVNRCHGC